MCWLLVYVIVAAGGGGGATTANEMRNVIIIISFYIVQYRNELLAQNSYSFCRHAGAFNSLHFVIAS